MLLCDYFVTTQCLYKILFTSWRLGSEWRSQQVMGKWFSMWIRPCLNIFRSPEKWNGNSPRCGLRTRPVRVFGIRSPIMACQYLGYTFPTTTNPTSWGTYEASSTIQSLGNMYVTIAPDWQPAEDFTHNQQKLWHLLTSMNPLSAPLILIDLPNCYYEWTMKKKGQNNRQTNM